MGTTMHYNVFNSLDVVVRDEHPAKREPTP